MVMNESIYNLPQSSFVSAVVSLSSTLPALSGFSGHHRRRLACSTRHLVIHKGPISINMASSLKLPCSTLLTILDLMASTYQVTT